MTNKKTGLTAMPLLPTNIVKKKIIQEDNQ
jgi:hypothetical protein